MRLERCVWGQIMCLVALLQSLDYFPNLMGIHWRILSYKEARGPSRMARQEKG